KKIEDKREELSNMLDMEVIQYAPEYIKDYISKEGTKRVDTAIDIFSGHLKKLTLKEGGIIPCEFEGLLETYNSLIVLNLKEIGTNRPKDIKMFFDSLLSQHGSILEDWYDEELNKVKIINNKKRRKELIPIINELVYNLDTTVNSRANKRFDKVRTEMEKGIYNLKSIMTEEDFARFLLKCLSVFYFKGVFSEYNKDSIKDIFPYHLSAAPYFNDDGELDKEGIANVDVKASELLIKSHFRKPDLGDLFDKL
ncbi:MAG: hypothetical protein KAJ55_16275, partial [Anaerolineales bacterium]|nr:hypothetical protein [Anaerolineales bacterium]